MDEIKTGMKIKLKKYEQYTDYKKHTGETGTITKIDDESWSHGSLPIEILWNDGTISWVTRENIIKIKLNYQTIKRLSK